MDRFLNPSAHVIIKESHLFIVGRRGFRGGRNKPVLGVPGEKELIVINKVAVFVVDGVSGFSVLYNFGVLVDVVGGVIEFPGLSEIDPFFRVRGDVGLIGVEHRPGGGHARPPTNVVVYVITGGDWGAVVCVLHPGLQVAIRFMMQGEVPVVVVAGSLSPAKTRCTVSCHQASPISTNPVSVWVILSKEA